MNLAFPLLFLVPQIQRYLQNSARGSLLRRIAEGRKSTVITLIHRQETVAFFGIPLARYIDIDDSEEVLRAIRTAPPDSPIDLILHTPGGIALAATQIALALRAEASIFGVKNFEEIREFIMSLVRMLRPVAVEAGVEAAAPEEATRQMWQS